MDDSFIPDSQDELRWTPEWEEEVFDKLENEDRFEVDASEDD